MHEMINKTIPAHTLFPLAMRCIANHIKESNHV